MEKILDTINQWIDIKIDSLASNNPNIALSSPRIKRGLHNILKQNKEAIEALMPFLTDDEGNIDIHNLKSEVLTIFNGLPQGEYEIGSMKILTDRGLMTLIIPDNILWRVFLGDIKSIKFNTNDIEELLNLFNR